MNFIIEGNPTAQQTDHMNQVERLINIMLHDYYKS